MVFPSAEMSLTQVPGLCSELHIAGAYSSLDPCLASDTEPLLSFTHGTCAGVACVRRVPEVASE